MRYGPKKDKSPFTKLQRFEQRRMALEKKLNGTGKYKFKNKTGGTLTLPKSVEINGQTVSIIGANGEFIGDSYFLQMVPSCLVILEDYNMQEKLMTEQPPTVTGAGTVEYVQASKQQKLNESKPGKQEDVLLTEDPVGGVVIVED